MKKRGKNKVRRKSYKKALANTEPEFYFRLINGQKIKNLFGLVSDLDKMPDDVFYHHVNEQRNDFGNWVRDIFKQKKLADEIIKARSRLEVQVTLLKFIVKKLR